MIQRIAAIAAAIALVAGAFVIRENVIEKDDGNGSTNGDGATAAVVCASELPDDVCETESAIGSTADELTANDAEAITWVTPGPWPQMIDESRRASSLEPLFDDVRPIASTELVAVVLRKPSQCAEITWRCLGDAAAGGRVSAASASTGTRLLIRAALLGGFIGRTDYAINDLDEVAGARDWIEAAERGIEQARRRQAGSLQAFLAARGAAADVFITTAAEARGFSDSSQPVTPTPLAVVIATAGTSGRFDAGDAADAFEDAGWATDPASIQKDSGLPSPGVLLALREVGS